MSLKHYASAACTIILTLTYAHAESCGIAEEGARYNMSYQTKENVYFVTWCQVHGDTCVPLATCDGFTAKRCTSRDENYGMQQNNNVYTLTILNVSRADNVTYMYYFTADASILYTCNLTIYAKPESPNCQSPTVTSDNTALSVTCSTDKVFPQVQCEFKRQGTPQGDLSDVTYTQENYTINGLPYFKSTCTLTYPVNSPGSYSFAVDMFLNIDNTRYGQKQSPVSDIISLSLPQGQVAADCPSGDGVIDGYIKTGTTATCRCDRVHDGLPVGQVQWYNTAGQEVGTVNSADGSTSLTISSFDPLQEFSCKGKSVLGVEPLGVSFGPTFAHQAGIETFTANERQSLVVDLLDRINLTCVANGKPPPTIIIQNHRATDQRTGEGYSLTYVKDNLACTETAVYICQVNNFVTTDRISEEQVQVFIRCPQQPQHGGNRTFSVTARDIVTLELDVIGYPAPVFYTLKQGEVVVARVFASNGNGRSGSYQFEYRSDDPPLGTIQLTIGNFSHDYFANYLLSIDNGLGQATEYSFKLRKASESSETDVVPIAVGIAFGVIAVVLIVVLIILKRKGLLKVPQNCKKKENVRGGTPNKTKDIDDLPAASKSVDSNMKSEAVAHYQPADSEGRMEAKVHLGQDKRYLYANTVDDSSHGCQDQEMSGKEMYSRPLGDQYENVVDPSQSVYEDVSPSHSPYENDD